MKEDVSEDYAKGFNHGYFFTKGNFSKLNSLLLKNKQIKEFSKTDDYFLGFEDGRLTLYEDVFKSGIKKDEKKNVVEKNSK
jgi:hypothetical protein